MIWERESLSLSMCVYIVLLICFYSLFRFWMSTCVSPFLHIFSL